MPAIHNPHACCVEARAIRRVDNTTDAAPDTVQLEISRDVLLRLLRERSLVASEVHYLNASSFRAGWQALKRALTGD